MMEFMNHEELRNASYNHLYDLDEKIKRTEKLIATIDKKMQSDSNPEFFAIKKEEEFKLARLNALMDYLVQVTHYLEFGDTNENI